MSGEGGRRSAPHPGEPSGLLIDLFPGVVFVIGEDDTVRYVNEGALRFLGLDREEIVGRPRHLFFPPEIAGRQAVALAKVFESGEPLRIESPASSPHQAVWQETHLVPLLDEEGRVYAVAGFAQDFTERHNIEEGLRDSRERYSMFLNAIDDALFVHGFEDDGSFGRFIEVNETACRWLGYSREELLGLRPEELVSSGDPAHSRRIIESLRQSKSILFESQLRTRDGGALAVEFSSHLVDLAGSPHVLSVARDRRERHRLQQTLRHSEKMNAVGQLAGGIAHDFNNQLVAIQGYAELLVRGMPEGEQRQFAEKILRCSQRGAALVEQLLTFSKQGARRIRPVDLRAVVSEVQALCEHYIDKRVAIVRSLGAGTTLVLGDPYLLVTALLNLALNARDAMADGGTLSFSVRDEELHAERLEALDLEAWQMGFVRLEVTDTGSGMSEQVRSRVFEPFFTTKKEGSGMGLATVYGTVRGFGGAIEVESEPGKGTTFRIYLRKTLRGVKEKVSQQELPRGGGARVLVVDDEEDVREYLCTALRLLGYRPTPCGDGAEAVELFRAEPRAFDLVLLDLAMPKMSGKEVFGRLRQLDPAVRVIFCTGYSARAPASSEVSGEGMEVLRKPFSLDTLSVAIAGALDLEKPAAGR